MEFGSLNTNRGRQLARRKFFRTISAVLAVVLIIWCTPIRSIARVVLAQVGTPLWEGAQTTSLAARRAVLFTLSRTELVNRAEKLAALEDQLAATQDELKTLREENARLQNVSADEAGTTAGRILSRPDQSMFDTIFIALGSHDGVKKGDLVFADDTVVLGSVDDVYPTSARVALYSRAGFSQSAFLSGAQTSVLLQGAGGQNFTVSLPQAISAAVGDTVSVSLANTNVVAEVYGITPDKNQPIKTLFLRSPVNIYKIEWIKLVHI